MNFPSQIYYRAAILKKNLCLLLFYVAVATYCYYKKVRRTMRTEIVSYLKSVFSRIWTESQILSIYAQIWIRENPYFGVFHAVFNMISAEYGQVYRMITLNIVRSIFKHTLFILLAVARYGNFPLISIN